MLLFLLHSALSAPNFEILIAVPCFKFKLYQARRKGGFEAITPGTGVVSGEGASHPIGDPWEDRYIWMCAAGQPHVEPSPQPFLWENLAGVFVTERDVKGPCCGCFMLEIHSPLAVCIGIHVSELFL